MRRLIQGIYDTSRYTNLVDKDRARMVYSMSTLMLTLLVVFMSVTRGADGRNLWQLLTAGSSLFIYVTLFFIPDSWQLHINPQWSAAICEHGADRCVYSRFKCHFHTERILRIQQRIGTRNHYPAVRAAVRNSRSEHCHGYDLWNGIVRHRESGKYSAAYH